MTRPYVWNTGIGTYGLIVSYRPYSSDGWPLCSWREWIVPGTLDVNA